MAMLSCPPDFPVIAMGCLHFKSGTCSWLIGDIQMWIFSVFYRPFQTLVKYCLQPSTEVVAIYFSGRIDLLCDNLI